MVFDNTKEVILIESLKQFVEHGYEATKISEITSAAGIDTSTFYNYFKSKKQVYDILLETSVQRFEEQVKIVQMDYEDESLTKKIVNMTEEEQIADIKQMFIITLHGDVSSLFTKFMNQEQYQHKDIASLYNRRYIFYQMRSFGALMELLMKEGIYKKGDSKMMALQYISPISLLLEACQREPEIEDTALQMLEEHIKQFNRIYKIQK